jgi:prepilin-type N-terminal cleavage/methylation domain-containing protein
MRRAFGLIEILVVVVVLVILAAVLIPRLTGGKTPDGRKAKGVITYAKDSVCVQNLRSDRQCIEAAQASDPDGGYPADLSQVREITGDLRKCAVGGEPYRYDPATGRISCPHPGHEGF